MIYIYISFVSLFGKNISVSHIPKFTKKSTPPLHSEVRVSLYQVSRRLFDFAGLTDSIGGAAKWCQDTVSQVWSLALHERLGRGHGKRDMLVDSGTKFLSRG